MMKRNLSFAACCCLLLWLVAPLCAEELSVEEPRIFSPTFAYAAEERVLAVEHYYEGVAGNITKAKITVVIAVAAGETEETLYSLKLGELNLVDSRDEENIPKTTITQGRLKFYVRLPDSVKVNDASEITGFGLVLIDEAGRQSPPIYTEVKLKQPHSI